MENAQSTEFDYKTSIEILTDISKFFEGIYNHESKRCSEMNNTLNWLTTILIALLLFSKQISDTNECINHLCFIIGIIVLVILPLLFVFFKIKYLRYESEMSKLLYKYSLECINLKTALLLDEDMKDFKERDYKKDLEKLNSILNSLNGLFTLAIIIFVISMALIPVYFILKATV